MRAPGTDPSIGTRGFVLLRTSASAYRSGVSQLRFEVLGPLRVTRDGREVELGPARRRAALAALLVDVGTTVPVDTLVDRIWDSRPPTNASASLQSYVSRLRAVLRDPEASGADGEGSGTAVLTAPPGYRLDVGATDVDAGRLDLAVDAARDLRASGGLRAARDGLDTALASWRGEPYADLSAAFVDVERVRLRARFDAARELRAHLDLDLGDTVRAVEDLTALATQYPLREPLHAALMLALYRGGRAAEALQHYAVARERLADELGVDPGVELRELHARLLREDPSLAAGVPPTARASAAPAPAPVAQPVAPATGTMVGRDAELTRALAVVDGTWSTRRASAVALVGEAGIGKSRLAEEIAARAAASGATVVWSRTWQHGEAPVLWPWVQVVRRLADIVGPDVTAAALSGRGAALGSLVPDLPGADARPVADVRTGGEVELQVFEAVEAFLRVVADDRRTVVVLEDLHWADAASQRLLEYLVGPADDCPVAFVAAVRSPAETGGRGPDLLAALARSGRATRIDLTGLGADDVRRYVSDRTGGDLDDATAAALVERTGGNPFFVGEIVALLTDAATGQDPVEQVPTTVRDVVRRRVADLGDDAGKVLATASLMVRTFDLDLLEQVSGLDGDVVDEAVDLATAAGLLGSEPGAPGVHRFTHALVADAVAETVGPARRRRQHARTADVLEERLASGDAVATGQLVHHLVATGDAVRIERAVELCCEAGGTARRRHDLAESEAVLLQALALTSRLPQAAADRWELAARTRLGALSVLIHGAHHPDTVAQRRRCQELLGGAGTAREVAVLQAQTWGAAMVVADFAAALAVSDEIAEVAAASDDALVHATATSTRGEALFHQGRIPEARAQLDEAVEYLRAAGPLPTDFELGLASPPAAWEMWRGVCLVLLGEADDLPAGLVARIEATSVRDPQLAAFNLGPLAIAGCFRDDPDRTEGPARRAEELAATAGLHHLLGYYRVMANWAAVRRATHPDPAAVEQMIAELAEFDPWTTMLMRPFHLGLCADALLRIDRPADAADRLDRAIAETRRTGNAQVLVENHRLRAIAWSRLGRDEADVAAELITAAAVAADQGNVLFGRRVEETAAELGVQLPEASSSNAASVRAPVSDITGLVTR